MKIYKDKITLIKNRRGCYILDTIKGCRICNIKPGGCYNDCYAKKIAMRYDYDFNIPIKRQFYKDVNQLYMLGFYDTSHIGKIVKQIRNIDMPFIRIGEMGDPSENWEHTINICKEISVAKKPIVIITKHWNKLSTKLLKEISKLNIHINTSISALDNNEEIEYRLNQYNELRKYCNSILRIISCDFNRHNIEGFEREKIQNELFKNNKIIDTVFRPSIGNNFIIRGVINIKKIKFLKTFQYASVYNKNTYLGYCNNCKEMCGVNI